MNKTHIAFLEACVDAGVAGHAPEGIEWVIAYRLRDLKLVEPVQRTCTDTPRFLATRMGKSLLNVRRSA